MLCVAISVLPLNTLTFHARHPWQAGLDTQYIFAAGDGVATWFISQEQFDLLSWCLEVLTLPTLPLVLSISWGGGESNYPFTHMTAANAEFQKLGLALGRARHQRFVGCVCLDWGAALLGPQGPQSLVLVTCSLPSLLSRTSFQSSLPTLSSRGGSQSTPLSQPSCS